MNSRTLIILGASLVALAVISKLGSGAKGPQENPAGLKPGARLLPLEDFNQVASLTFADSTQKLELAKSGSNWVVKSLFGYPADFNRVADELNKYSELRVGQVMRASPAQIKEFGLDPAATGEGVTKPAVATLADASGKTLVTLNIGAERSRPSSGGQGGFPDSHYVKVNDGPVVLVDQYLGRPGMSGHDWIGTQLLGVNADELTEVDIRDKDGKAYGLTRAADGKFVAKAKADKEEVKNEGAQSVFGSISYLSISDVAGPAGSVPNAFADNGPQFKAKTRDGVVYQLDIGATNANGSRYLKLAATYEKPAPPAVTNAPAAGSTNVPPELVAYETSVSNAQKTVASVTSKHAPWIYLVADSSTANLTMPREQVIAIPPPPTNAPAAANTVVSPPVEVK